MVESFLPTQFSVSSLPAEEKAALKEALPGFAEGADCPPVNYPVWDETVTLSA